MYMIVMGATLICCDLSICDGYVVWDATFVWSSAKCFKTEFTWSLLAGGKYFCFVMCASWSEVYVFLDWLESSLSVIAPEIFCTREYCSVAWSNASFKAAFSSCFCFCCCCCRSCFCRSNSLSRVSKSHLRTRLIPSFEIFQWYLRIAKLKVFS